MNNLCLPSSVGKLCQVLSSISVRGRCLSHHVSKLRPSSSENLPVGFLRTEGQKTWLNRAPLASANSAASRLNMGEQNPWVNQSLVSSFNNPAYQQRICQGTPSTPLEYVCPSNKNTSNTIILDRAISQNTIIDCPTLPRIFHDISLPELKIHQIIDPFPHGKDGVDKTPPAIEARQILKIRRRKMNRHLLKKFRKRMAFTLRKQRLLMEKKKEAAFQAKLDVIRKSGEDFNALEFVQKELEMARKGGFQIDVFGPK
ncbi:uncharacterized protein LOC121390072 [Gigantopelta aegis]|uniref:uncharacterized protein LOC121390072 n=1 Tax=Gigantopelta aegis TaxID=1735272 RepID=UPI001B88E269|nr:uncharacterized protein LOC121390072 [Gigantopelta aegis]